MAGPARPLRTAIDVACQLHASPRAQCDKLFDQFDADHSGAMDAAELRAMLTGLTIALGDDPSLELHITHW